MKRAKWFLCLAMSVGCLAASAHEFNGPYRGAELDHIAMPVGGIGTGMFCFEGTGAISHLSLRHSPELFNEPCTFAAICVKGLEHGTRVLEAPVPSYKIFGRTNGGLGSGSTTWGFPRFDEGAFLFRFPFGELSLRDRDLPLEARIVVWNPFIPGDADDSGLPVAGFEYTFINSSATPVEAVFSFNTTNFLNKTKDSLARIRPLAGGFILEQDGNAKHPEYQAQFAVYTDDPAATVNPCWFRGGWFDPLTMAWNHASDGQLHQGMAGKEAPGASIYIPLSLQPGESRTVRIRMAWYVPVSNLRNGADARQDSDYGSRYNPEDWKNVPQFYEPYYSHRFGSLAEVMNYWNTDYETLRAQTALFTETFYDSTLPAEVLEAVASNLTILKSPTVLRQSDGRFWAWEGCGDNKGSCRGTCTHVWNYAQALPHLFPALERSCRETEFLVDQNVEGHQVFRTCLPIRPPRHNFHSACDGQLGGIIKVYRDWRISGDNAWIKDLYPQIKQSLDYCIRTWDPDEVGALVEPHHNTYDIEFWGPDGMCTSVYAGALASFVEIGHFLKQDVLRYEALLAKAQNYLATELWNGEYFHQQVRWKGLRAGDPTTAQMFHSGYSPEARAILEQEGPKYQYGTGCISDGVIGGWMALTAGLDEPIDREKVSSHLRSVYKYNLRHDLARHANPQRPGYAVGHEGGLLLCTWPRGGKPSLPFVYSDEVWTGIEYQVAAHLIFEGCVDEGLDIVRTCRRRYDGTLRNPLNEYECGSWYARAMSSYSLLQALTGVRYDAVTRTLYIDSRVGDFRSFLSTATGFATVSLEAGQPTIKVASGTIDIKRCFVSGKKAKLKVL